MLLIRQLIALQDMEIGLHPKSWQTTCEKTEVESPSQDKNTAPSATRVVRMQLYTLQDCLKLETDSDTLVKSSKFMVHVSRAALPTARIRTYGASLVTASALLCSDSFAGSRRGAMK